MDLGKHSDCQRSPKARASLLPRSWVHLVLVDHYNIHSSSFDKQIHRPVLKPPLLLLPLAPPSDSQLPRQPQSKLVCQDVCKVLGPQCELVQPAEVGRVGHRTGATALHLGNGALVRAPLLRLADELSNRCLQVAHDRKEVPNASVAAVQVDPFRHRQGRDAVKAVRFDFAGQHVAVHEPRL